MLDCLIFYNTKLCCFSEAVQYSDCYQTYDGMKCNEMSNMLSEKYNTEISVIKNNRYEK